MQKLTEEELEIKWRDKREAFKAAILPKMKANPALAMLAINTWSASNHRTHIHQMWKLLGNNHKGAWNDYCEKLHGKMLTGRDEFTFSLRWVDKELYELARELPEVYVLEDAKDLAYTVFK